jgi:aspartate 1-decarboxylase
MGQARLNYVGVCRIRESLLDDVDINDLMST